MKNKDNPYIIRNYQLMKKIFSNIITSSSVAYYKLKVPEVLFINLLCERFNSFRYYIEYRYEDFSHLISKRSFHRILDRLENENIVNIVDKAKNKHSISKLYFTEKFINKLCGEEFGELYSHWLEWRKEESKM